MNLFSYFLYFLILNVFLFCHPVVHAVVATPPTPKVKVGLDLIMGPEFAGKLKNKRIGLITNHTAVDGRLTSIVDIFKKHASSKEYKLVALFAPEHGMTGASYAEEAIEESKDVDGIPIFSLHGKTRRLNDQMLKQVNLLIFDIQDIGSRSYTYISTLFYAMEEAAKRNIPLIVLDRPNPMTGLVVDGPLLEEKWRSFLGYINIPYCHGMTVGELAHYFNSEYKINCKLDVVAMKGWQRWMNFQDTGLPWIPTSPYIPESNTPFFYPTTGILGTLQLVNIGIGYTLPFKVVGAPWINAASFAKSLNAQKFPGVHFEPFHYRPFYGRFARQDCQGVLIVITEPAKFRPVTTQYLIIGILKSLYPKQFQDAITAAKANKESICKINGTEEVYRLIVEEKNIVWKLRDVHMQEREDFLKLRKKYLIYKTSQII